MRLLFTLIWLLCCSALFAQNSVVYAPAVEFYVYTEECSTPVTFYLSRQTTTWGHLNGSSTFSIMNLDPSPHTAINSSMAINGFELQGNDGYSGNVYGWGLYTLTTNIGHTIHIDFRDCGYGSYPGQPYTPTDIFVKYNDRLDEMRIAPDSNGPWSGPIGNGESFNIWTLKGQPGPDRSGFTPYPVSNLVMNFKDEDNPTLTWANNPNTDDFRQKYKIYRCVTQNSEEIPTNFIPISEITDVNQETFVDYNATSGGWKYVYYRVTSANTSAESEPSNTVSAALVTVLGKKMLKQHDISYADYRLFQNYPNPFNPSTKIVYSLKNKENVLVKIYDLLGNEVKTLVNQIEGPGMHEVQFDGSSLPSGTYIYSIRAGEFSANKKLMLVK